MYSEKVRAELLGGALADHKTHYAGYCQGYYMTFVPQADGYRVTVNASLPADPGNAALYSFLAPGGRIKRSPPWPSPRSASMW